MHHELDHPSDAAFWDQKYHGHLPSNGEPNPVLAQEIEGLQPGTALDLGCGEGADALWLAQRGWQVTAVDVSHVALDRGRAADTAQHVTWVQADMLVWQLPADAYDLVSLHYVHVPPAERAGLFDRVARSVRPTGTLLVVAHHPSDRETTIGRPPMPSLYFTADEVAEWLAPGRWEILLKGKRPRKVTDRHGNPLTIQDTVLKARRIA
jgi:SAM-dependent methyltransferase